MTCDEINFGDLVKLEISRTPKIIDINLIPPKIEVWPGHTYHTNIVGYCARKSEKDITLTHYNPAQKRLPKMFVPSYKYALDKIAKYEILEKISE